MITGLLSGKVALITGAAGGIGQAAAQVFARHGANVMLSDVKEEGGQQTAQSIRAAGGSAAFLRADVSQARDVEALVQTTVELFGGLDCAFNNAGIDGIMAPTADCTEENWNRVIAVNLTGVFLCMKYEIPAMLKRGGGAIVNTSSAAGLIGSSLGLSAYVASKHGVIGLTRSAALEYAKRGIRVNAVCPGAIRTPMLDDAIRQGILTEESAASMEPIGRIGEPHEIAETAAWLCSGAASFVTGHAMSADGGMTAGQ